MDLGDRIRRLRLQRQMSVRQLAARSGLSPSQTSAIERGRRTSAEAIVRLARALEVDISTLVQDADLIGEERAEYEDARRREIVTHPLPRGLQELIDDPALALVLDQELVASLATLSLPRHQRLSKRQYHVLYLVLDEFLQR